MASIYDKIGTAEELLREVRMHGLSTKQEDICRAQDIFGNSPYRELIRLANDNGRKNADGEPDPNGSISDGSTGMRAVFYQVAFHIWNWEDATRFYNENSNPLYQEGREAVKEKRDLEAKIGKLTSEVDAGRKLLENEAHACLDLQQKAKALEAQVHARDMEIMELKAKLYDLMTSERKEV